MCIRDRFIINDIAKYIDAKKDVPAYKLECLYESSCGAVVYRDIKLSLIHI